MARRSTFEDHLFALNLPFKRKKRTRAEELRELVHEAIEELDLLDHRGKLRDFGVTFDRMPNRHFDYWLFDELLVQLGAGAGRRGIRKPLNQLRVVSWRKSAADLSTAIRIVCRNYDELKFSRMLVFPLEGDQAGCRLTKGLYRA
ncbi:hypothetical protein [Aureimonas phyllosphaerae]|uniref:Uncharacterized protein n=1 Tax=Aureimonas phyllosphaerae TaxID=1166078 RepID=A0A7W6BUF3_9HYPH|nr:hypothetical protein [Aureimonas phyllosphaerae]MBB3938209.1 hypothetical protein [Aureimonas phyllosphaerae]MBB3962209.1 hypothetical protein [Aureimonas phyllosphaerae]